MQYILAYHYYDCDVEVTNGNTKYSENGHIKEVAIYNQIPEVEHSLDRKKGNKKQKIYEIQDIIDLLEK